MESPRGGAASTASVAMILGGRRRDGDPGGQEARDRDGHDLHREAASPSLAQRNPSARVVYRASSELRKASRMKPA